MTKIIFILGCCGMFCGSFVKAADPMLPEDTCRYSYAPDQVKVQWKAFKTTEKIGVGGSFLKVKVTQKKTRHASIEELLKAVDATVELSSVDSGNPKRDETLKQEFFGKFKKAMTATGRILLVNADGNGPTSGKFILELAMNGVKKPVSMQYQVIETPVAGKEPTLEFKAQGKFDFVDWGIESALSSLNLACQDLHKGKDGVSKTWSDVELTLSAPIQKNCSKGK